MKHVWRFLVGILIVASPGQVQAKTLEGRTPHDQAVVFRKTVEYDPDMESMLNRVRGQLGPVAEGRLYANQLQGSYVWLSFGILVTTDDLDWPRGQVIALVLSDSSAVTASELYVMAAGHLQEVIHLGRSDLRLPVNQLWRDRSDRRLVIVYAGFDRAHKLKRGQRLVDWSADDAIAVRVGPRNVFSSLAAPTITKGGGPAGSHP